MLSQRQEIEDTKTQKAEWDKLDSDPRCIAKLGMNLGEGPVWVASRNSFFFTDIKSCRIYELCMTDKKIRSWDAPEMVAFILPTNDKTLILGHPSSLGQFSLDTHEFSSLKQVEDEPKNNRLNDGCVCPDGNIWFGTMGRSEASSTGAIYHVSSNPDVEGGIEIVCKERDYTISNGPAISPDGRVAYICDSPKQVIYAYDRVDEHLHNCRVFVELDDGCPDGVVTDSQGNLWCAVWGGSRVDCYSPEGKKILTKKFPVTNVTKIAFGGNDMRDVLVTTASKGLTDAEKKTQPLAGGVFMFRSEIAGRPQGLFKIK